MAVKKLNKKSTKRQRLTVVSLIVLGTFLIGWGGLYFINRYLKKSVKTSVPFSNAVNAASERPDEKKPDIGTKYVVPSDHPRRIVSDSIGINGFIQSVGLSKKSEISVPNNIHIGGWFTGSVKPGDRGLSIIGGHYSGIYTKDAIFKSLHEFAAGETFAIEFGNLTMRNFEVVEVKKVTEQNSARSLFTKDVNIDAQLNLITCDGKFNSKNQTYDERTIVVSKAL